MKTMILILGVLFGVLAIWALFETFRAQKKSVTKHHVTPRVSPKPSTKTDPQSLIPTDPYGAGKMRRGMRDTMPPGQRLH